MIREHLTRWTLAAVLSVVTVAVAAPPSGADDGRRGKQARVEGTLTAVDTAKQTVTITPRKGAAVTINLTATTRAEIDDRDVAPSKLLDPTLIGMHAEATYDAATKNALRVEIGTDD